MKFDDAVAFVLEAEGETSNLSNDPGGVTHWGISKRAYPNMDVENLTKDQAVAIYKRDYWDKLHCDELPNGLDLLVFDAAVNQGPVAAVRMLQGLLKSVPQDGIIGPETIGAARARPEIVSEYLAKRMFQYALVPQILQFGQGWYRRLAKAAAIAFSA